MATSEDLKILIDSEPANAARTDEEVLSWCNTPTIDRERRQLSGSEILEVTDGVEFAAKTADEKSVWLSICAVESVLISNSSVLARVAVDTFGSGSTTIANLKTLREYTSSPADNAGLGKVRLGHVEIARSL